MANTLVWDSAGVARPWVRRGQPAAVVPGRAGRRAARAVTVRAAGVRPHRRRQPIAWRRLAALSADILMVAIWAGMIPGLMWLGTAAGF